MADKKPEIHIKEKNKGKFTDYCKDKGHEGVTNECIEEGLASNSAKTRARAQFASNVRKFEH